MEGSSQFLAFSLFLEAFIRVDEWQRELLNEDLKKDHQVHLVDFVLESTLPGSVQDASSCEEVKALSDKR
ncbi:hypothetical protein JHK82_024782 [Glycine max]|nr:hypothetical protein JHK86_024899 [Glycine max]KAG5133594.1 hypothetical protein JHK82_024782 [Glycine max]